MNRPTKGSPEAYAWAEKMRKTRERIRKAGIKTERSFFDKAGKIRDPFFRRNLRRVCAWCKKPLGETAPFADTRETHGMCDACFKRQMASLKRNPTRKRRIKKNPIAIYNPPKVVGTIYNNAIEIRAQKTSTLRGYYKHIFDSGKVQILGLDNGDVLLHHKGGKRLWMSRKDYERSGNRHE